MLVLTLLMYCYAFVRIKTGSGIKDVKTIVLLLIISSAFALIVIGEGLFTASCPQTYTGFSEGWIENNVTAKIVSKTSNNDTAFRTTTVHM